MKKAVMAAMAAGVISVSAVGAGVAFAAEGNPNTPMDSLVTAIAERFHLDEAEVQAVFDEQHAVLRARHEQVTEDRMAKAVEDGKLTQAQADAVAAKLEESKAFLKSLKDMSDDERRGAMDAYREEMKEWIDENNIPHEFLKFGRAGHHGRGLWHLRPSTETPEDRE